MPSIGMEPQSARMMRHQRPTSGNKIDKQVIQNQHAKVSCSEGEAIQAMSVPSISSSALWSSANFSIPSGSLSDAICVQRQLSNSALVETQIPIASTGHKLCCECKCIDKNTQIQKWSLTSKSSSSWSSFITFPDEQVSTSFQLHKTVRTWTPQSNDVWDSL